MVKRLIPLQAHYRCLSLDRFPKFLEIENVFFPVRLFVPRVYNCTNCKKLGHTAAFCDNKPRCGKCSQDHMEGACQQEATKCAYCGKEPLHALQDCPAYKKRTNNVKRSIKERSKLTFAEMVKLQNGTSASLASAAQNENTFEILSSDELDSDIADESESPEVHAPGKRKPTSSPGVRRKKNKTTLKSMQKSEGSGDSLKKPNKSVIAAPSDPCCSFSTPPLPNKGNRKRLPKINTTSTRNSKKTLPSKRGKIKFKDIVDNILNALGFLDESPLRGLIDLLVPIVGNYFKQLTASWPLIGEFISFDG